MNNIKGIVVEIDKNTAVLLTSTGEFMEVIATKDMSLGKEYVKTITHISFIRNIPKTLIAALLMFTLLGGGFGAYYTPVTTLTLHINPSVQLKTNLFNRVIYSAALNSDGKIILDNINIKNKNFNDALSLIVTESEHQKFITEDYKTSKSISLEVKGKNLDVSTFQGTVKSHGISIKVKINNKEDFVDNNNKNNNLVNPNKDLNKLNSDNNSKNDKDKNSLKNMNSNLNVEESSQKTVKESNHKQDNTKNNEPTDNKDIKASKSKKNLNEKKINTLNPKKDDTNSSNDKILKKQK